MTRAKSNRPDWIRALFRKAGLQDRAFLCAIYVAFPNALITLGLRNMINVGFLPGFSTSANGDNDSFQVETSVWTASLAGLTFLTVFRASQAYTRFWQAITSVHLLQIEWLDAFGSILAFCATSSSAKETCQKFKHEMARLFSLYHAAALLRLVEPGIDDQAIAGIKVLDPLVFDDDTTNAFSESEHRFELVKQWIQVTIMHGIQDKVVCAPPPLVSRCFQEIANGNVKFQDALKVKSIPFPPAYQHLCDFLLILHWIATPFFTSLWVNSPTLAAILAFLSVLTLWSMTFVARSIENPFSTHQFIREAADMQEDLNSRLMVLLTPIAEEAPQMPFLSDDDLESCIVSKATLGTVFARTARPSVSVSDLVTQATQPSKVKFRSRTIPLPFCANLKENMRESGHRHLPESSASSSLGISAVRRVEACAEVAGISETNVTETVEPGHVVLTPNDSSEPGDLSSATAPEISHAKVAFGTKDSPSIVSEEGLTGELVGVHGWSHQPRLCFSGGAPAPGPSPASVQQRHHTAPAQARTEI